MINTNIKADLVMVCGFILISTNIKADLLKVVGLLSTGHKKFPSIFRRGVKSKASLRAVMSILCLV